MPRTAFAEDDAGISVEDLEQGAELGIALMQYYLGIKYYSIGQGVPQDYKEAMKWFRKAAEQGHAIAQYNLGFMYYKGRGIPQDYVESYAWFNISAAQGDEGASEARDGAAKKLSEALAKAQELSKEYYRKYVEPFQ